ncbi:synaptopodin-2 isoform X1 [Sander lucioperca]|uniref:synaptopodin-2 isoform X1 n=1 Tax=Sander lucioperca TaxID=283035 RepID=UPI001653D86F|nr:synaptopodin-2 isoform X1 [Sander lucioperca]
MEPEAEDPDNNDNLVPWSGSDGSQELCESYNEDDASDAEYPLDPLPAHIQMSESTECLQSQDWESAGEQHSLPELSGSEEDISYQEEDDYLSESRESITESPHIQPSPTSQSPHRQRPESEPHAGQISRLHSQSSSSSLGCAADMTLALTLTTEQPLGASNRQGPGTRNRRVESSEEGGSSEAPPASVFFGISDEAAEQAEKWNSESDTDLCRPDRHRARSTRLSHNESQSERNVKETKSKCKRIARLLTDAPNPQNKGALLFEKRRQRVKKYTLVSYGTGENKLDSKGQIDEETEVRSAGYNFIATSESELEEEYSVYHQQRNLSLNWESVGEMDALPETKGKGVMMFVQRRKRMDDIVSEHEELRNKGLPVETLTEPERTEAQNIYDTEEMYVHSDQAKYIDANLKQHVEHQESLQQMNHLSNVPRPLVPNRTAKPFLGLHVSTTTPALPGGVVPVTKKHEPRFRVPVPINTYPQVWSPTGDIIASRDERISVPAIKTGILPESKRKAANKQQSKLAQGSDLHLQNKGERRSYIETEEDCFSLGAEACNFMQPRTTKLKNPPPVAPKPTINPSCPPWMGRSPSGEPYIPPRSPVSQPSHSSVGTHSQHYLQQQDWAQSQQMGNHWAPNQTQATLQTPAKAWVPVNSSSQLHLQPTTNSWSQQPSQSPVSMQARSPTYSPHHPPSPSRNKLDSAPNSVASYPPQAEKSYTYATKASQASLEGRVSGRGINRAGDGPTMAGKGAELFAKRQSRMEKFVVDAETVQANKTRSPSPTLSLPNSYRYSSIVRAPPPLSYNPLLAPFYPPSAAKQTPSTSPKIKPKTKAKPKAAPKHLNPLDIMKHQPYQLDASLFKYNAVPEAESPSPKPPPASKFEVIKNLKHRSDPSYSPNNASELVVQSKAEVPAKSPVSGFGRSRSLSLPKRLNSMPSPRVVSPASTLGIQLSFLPAQRQTSFQEKVYKPLSPWDAASRSPIGSVDDAFVFQSLPSSVASNVKAIAHRRSLPEPPDEWKRRVSLDPAAVSMGRYHAAPAFQAPFMSRTFSPEKPAFYGPPFRPAQPLGPDSRASIGYMGHGSSPTKYSPLHSAVQRS